MLGVSVISFSRKTIQFTFLGCFYTNAYAFVLRFLLSIIDISASDARRQERTNDFVSCQVVIAIGHNTNTLLKTFIAIQNRKTRLMIACVGEIVTVSCIQRCVVVRGY